LKKFDYSVKKQIMNSKKVFTTDHAFATRLGFNFSENKGRILENIVYIELLRRGYEVYYYSGNNECDFLIKKGLNIVKAIQVVDHLDKTNYEREYRGLQEAMKTYEIPQGILITNSIEASFIPDYEEIETVSVWKWLL